MDTIGVGSHQPVLLEMVKKTTGPILELGAGEYSTGQIHRAAKDRKILTIETNKEWLARYTKLTNNNHSFLYLTEDESKEYYIKDTEDWNVVFVDSITWDIRMATINKYRDHSDFMIIHDTSYSARIGVFGKEIKPMTELDPGLRDFGGVFKYWKEFLPINWEIVDPPTVLGSNRFDLKDIIIPSMIEINNNI